MATYEDIPCSVVQFRDETPQKPAIPEKPSRKLCSSAPNPRKEIPDHPGLHRKTIAFGKTVNVSQTVEATSRAAKKSMNTANSAGSSPMQAQNVTENNEDQEDFLKIIQEELAATRRQIQEENAKKQEELNEQNLKKMQEMMSSFFQQIAISQPSVTGKENAIIPRPENKIALARRKIQRDGKIPPEVISILEESIRSNPAFRQTVDDVLAEAEYQMITDRKSPDPYSPSRPSAFPSSPMYTGGAYPSNVLRETVTVARSVLYENGLESVDHRRMTRQRSDERDHEPFGNSSADPLLQSTYQPGNSVSYYPSNSNRRAVRDYEENDESSEGTEDIYLRRAETKEEKERRIRQKYGRRN